MPGYLSSTGNWVDGIVLWDSEGFTGLGHKKTSKACNLKTAVFLEEKVVLNTTEQTQTILSNLCLSDIRPKAVGSIPIWALSWRVGLDDPRRSNSEQSVNIQSVSSGVISGESAVSAASAAGVYVRDFVSRLIEDVKNLQDNKLRKY